MALIVETCGQGYFCYCFGQIVTFQAPKEYKEAINSALRLYSRGGGGNPIAEDWDDVKESFFISLKTIRNLAHTSEDIAGLSRKQKKAFVNLFRALDHDFAHLKSFSVYEPHVLDAFGFSEEEYENYAAMYKNVMEELKKPNDNLDQEEEPVWDDYDLVAYSKLSILLTQVVDGIEKDKERFLGQDISVIISQMRYSVIDAEIRRYAEKWYLDFEDVRYEVFHFRDGKLANENKLKDSADYAAYKEENKDALPKLKFRKQMIDEFKNDLMPEIEPLID